MVKINSDGDDPYRGVLDEWAREQQQAAARDRERDKMVEEGDNGGRGGEEFEEIALRTRQTRLERDLVELMKQTRRDLALALLVARERASHPYIAGLERENAALREIAQAVVATMGSTWQWHACPFCGEDSRPGYVLSGRRDPIEHAPDCPVTKARALLAGKEGDGG